MKRIIFDTNAFLRFFLNDIPEQKKIVEKLLQQASHSEAVLLVPQIVIFEFNFILDTYYHFQKEEIVTSIKSLVSMSYLEIESKEIFQKAILIFEANNMSFVDSFLLANAEIQDADLFTFDKNYRK